MASDDAWKSDTKHSDHLADEEAHAETKADALDPDSPAAAVAQLSEAERKAIEKKLLRKIDWRMSIMILIYILNYMDRNNISAARLKGFQQDLHLTDTQYQTCLSMLYVGYILMQVPSNLFLNRIGKPSLYLPTAMMLWGLLSLLTGVVTNYTGAVLCRFFLGFVEAAFFPGALFLLSKWYTKRELALRTAILYLGNLSSNAFNGLIASGILANMQGVLGHAAWRWLFYIEGAITIFVALCAVFILPDFPDTTRWLSPQEKFIAQSRLVDDGGEDDTGKGEAKSSLQTFWSIVSDYHVWLLLLILTAQVQGLSFNAFFPTLTKELEKSTTLSLLLTAPPWFFSMAVSALVAWHADRTQEKFFHIAGPTVVAMVGCILAWTTTSVAPRYVALFLMAQGYAGFILIFSWISSTIARPTAKRAGALAFINCLSQLANISGSYSWPSKWAPYHKSFAISFSCFALSIVVAFILRWDLKRLNAKMDRHEAEPELHNAAVEQAAKLEGTDIETMRQIRQGWRYIY